MSSIVWKKGSSHHIVSDCGNYKVCQTSRDSYIRFTAWRKASDICSVALDVFKTAEEAKNKCEEDKKASFNDGN